MICEPCGAITTYRATIRVEGRYKFVDKPICLTCLECWMEVAPMFDIDTDIDLYEPIMDNVSEFPT